MILKKAPTKRGFFLNLNLKKARLKYMDFNEKFKSAYKNLNPEQKKAVDLIEGPSMVVAGPGTGKTHLLTMRIANILFKTDTPPESILCLTYRWSNSVFSFSLKMLIK